MLGTALGAESHLVCCTTEYQLWQELSRPGVGVLVLELTLDCRPRPASLVAAVRGRFAAIPIVGYGWLTQSLAAEVLACARQGLDAIALRGFNDLRTVICRALAECNGAEQVVLLDLHHWLPPALLEMVEALLQRLDEAPQLDQLARLLGRSPRTLQRIARQEHCCSPGDLICAVRILVAARLLVYEALPMKQVLSRTGYQSTRALRAGLGRCGLCPLKRLRGAAGYAAARDALLRFICPVGYVSVVAPKRPDRTPNARLLAPASAARRKAR